jgi:uncharacterized protein (TIGR02217 family)
VQATVLVAVGGIAQTEGTAFTVDDTTGLLTFATGSIPPLGAVVTAGFEFDVPVRFDADKIEVNLSSFKAGSIPHIPILEIRL